MEQAEQALLFDTNQLATAQTPWVNLVGTSRWMVFGNHFLILFAQNIHKMSPQFGNFGMAPGYSLLHFPLRGCSNRIPGSRSYKGSEGFHLHGGPLTEARKGSDGAPAISSVAYCGWLRNPASPSLDAWNHLKPDGMFTTNVSTGASDFATILNHGRLRESMWFLWIHRDHLLLKQCLHGVCFKDVFNDFNVCLYHAIHI